MKRLLLGAFALFLSATTAFAAAGDNQLVITPGVGVTFRCKDTNGAGLQSCLSIPGDANGNIAWGTAGTANANVMTVQGIAAMTPFLVAQSGTWNITTVTTLTGITNALPAGTNLLGKTGIDQTTPGTTNAVSLAQIGATTTASGNGVVGAGVQRVAIASDNTAFSVNAVQSGTWNITNISGTVSLPTGASTSALQPTNAAIASTTAAQTGHLVMGAVTTGNPTYTTAQTNPLSLDTSGGLRVSIIAGGGSGGTASSFAAAFPATGTAIGAKNGANMVNLTADASNNLNVNVQSATGIASAASVSGATGSLIGGRAQNVEATAVANGQFVFAALDLVGKTITSPYANKENFTSGTASATGTGATTIIAAQAGSLKNYITGVQCARDDAGTTASRVTFNDVNATVLVLPNNGGGGGNNAVYQTPIATAAATAFQFTSSSSITTIRCSAQGYAGT